MSEGKVYKTRECARRAQERYMNGLKNSEKAEDKEKWLKMCQSQSAGGVESMRRMYANPCENEARLEKVRAQKREYARKVYADPVKNAARNLRRRELRAQKKEESKAN